MDLTTHPYIYYLLTFAIAMVVSLYTVRKVLFITTKRKIYDIPDDTRKIHGPGIPSLGGIGIFTGYIVAAAYFMLSRNMNMIVASSVILFFTGVYDDLMNMRPSKKLMAQLIASLLTVYFTDIRIDSLYGLMGVYAIPSWASITITTLGCTFFINAFNFIDGIDGLACALGILYTGLLGFMFAALGRPDIACLSFSMAGATIGLLFYNRPPAKIYMGDTGSMLIGFTVFILSVLSIDLYALHPNNTGNMLMIVLAIIYVPVYDAIRVFLLRASKGKSPLKADRTHLHYYLLDAGATHTQAVLVIVATNILLIALAWAMQAVSPYLTLLCITTVMSAVLLIVYLFRQRRMCK